MTASLIITADDTDNGLVGENGKFLVFCKILDKNGQKPWTEIFLNKYMNLIHFATIYAVNYIIKLSSILFLAVFLH